MSDIKLNTAGDIDISEPDLQLTSGTNAIDQHLKQRLRMFLGEWFLDNRIGLPYFQHILKKNPDAIVIDSVFKRQILTTPGVLELLSFNLDIDIPTRQLTVEFRARTSEGVIDFSLEVP